MAIFKWLEKSFEVSNKQILTYNSLSASHSFQTEEKKNGKNMPKTKEVAPGIGSLNITVKLSATYGNNVKNEHDWWVNECEKGTYSFIYMSGVQFGNYKWRIKQVDVSDLLTSEIVVKNDRGEITSSDILWKSCTLSIGFEEYYVKVKLTKAEKKAAKLQKKMRKQMAKAENAKNEKAREKALQKAETLAVQFKEQETAAAVAISERAKTLAEIERRINDKLK